MSINSSKIFNYIHAQLSEYDVFNLKIGDVHKLLIQIENVFSFKPRDINEHLTLESTIEKLILEECIDRLLIRADFEKIKSNNIFKVIPKFLTFTKKEVQNLLSQKIDKRIEFLQDILSTDEDEDVVIFNESSFHDDEQPKDEHFYLCEREGCKRWAQRATGLCISHKGAELCEKEGCMKKSFKMNNCEKHWLENGLYLDFSQIKMK